MLDDRNSPVSTTSSNATPAKIQQLPCEILDIIIELTAEHARHRADTQFLGWEYPVYEHSDLKSMALTCRRLYHQCVPYLWQDKELILPREDDEKSDSAGVQLATDILSRKAPFHGARQFGSFVRSLCRDLTNGPHYDLRNSRLLAQLVPNLRALRIDFHPKARSEHYGLRFFFANCPLLTTLYLENCRDTFDDFATLIEYHPPLSSLTLLCCTVKHHTFKRLIEIYQGKLRTLLLQRVLIEPSTDDAAHNILNLTAAAIAVNHVTPIPSSTYTSIFHSQSFHRIALSDAVSYSMLKTLIEHSPNLEKLAVVLNESDPDLTTRCILLLTRLQRLRILSLAFRRVHPLSRAYERLPCRAPSFAWLYFAQHLPHLRVIHISTTRMLLTRDFWMQLFGCHEQLQQVMLHHVSWVPPNYPLNNQDDAASSSNNSVVDHYLADLSMAKDSVQPWMQETGVWEKFGHHFLTIDDALTRGLDELVESDPICFCLGFEKVLEEIWFINITSCATIDLDHTTAQWCAAADRGIWDCTVLSRSKNSGIFSSLVSIGAVVIGHITAVETPNLPKGYKSGPSLPGGESLSFSPEHGAESPVGVEQAKLALQGCCQGAGGCLRPRCTGEL